MKLNPLTKLAIFTLLLSAMVGLAPGVAQAERPKVLMNTIGGFEIPEAIATDAAGNVYVVDGKACTVSKWDAAGNPVKFADLPSNVIPCQHEIVGFNKEFFTAITVAPPGAPAGIEGTIYFTMKSSESGVYTVASYSPAGDFLRYNNTTKSRWACGLSFSPAKELYMSAFGLEGARSYIERYLPTTNPFTEADLVGTFTTSGAGICDTAEDASGNVYGVNVPTGPLYKYPPSAFGGISGGEVFAPVARSVDIDPTTGDIYDLRNNDVAVLNPAGEVLSTFGAGSLNEPQSIAVDPTSGDVFVSNGGNGTVSVFGPPPPEAPPVISEARATEVEAHRATLRAKLNGNGVETHYHFEYVGDGEFQASGFADAKKIPVPDAVRPGSAGPGQVLTEVMGLEADTTYHFRLVAENEFGGTEGEVASFTTGSDPYPAGPCPNEEFRVGLSAGLPDCRAYEMVSPIDKNGGDVAAGLILRPGRAQEELGGLHFSQASLSGEEITYSSAQPFPGALSGPIASQYLSTRDPARGWVTKAISPPQEGQAAIRNVVERVLKEPFGEFSPDLGTAWLSTMTEPVLGAGGIAGAGNVYRRDNSSESYAGCTSAPRAREENTLIRFEGAAADEQEALFVAENPLTENASRKKNIEGDPIPQLYMCSLGESGPASIRLVSVLPNGKAFSGESYAGSTVNGERFGVNAEEGPTWDDAISADGSRVFWSTGSPSEISEVPAEDRNLLYVRVNAGSEPTESGKCTPAEPDGACTLAVSEGIAKRPARYLAFTKNGSQALFTVAGPSGIEAGNNLYLFTVDKALAGEPGASLIAEEVLGVLGESEDLSDIYYTSKQASPAQEAEGAVEGEANLYLYESSAGVSSFVTVLERREGGKGLGNLISSSPGAANMNVNLRLSRVSPDGRYLFFMSDSPPLSEEVAGYDNIDPENEFPIAEIYRYDSVEKELSCISCNPTGAPPTGEPLGGETNGPRSIIWAASVLPTWPAAFDPTHPASPDGRRVFFNSIEALVPRDTNGVRDVYEWEMAEGSSAEDRRRNCEQEKGADVYVPANKGCLSLISPGNGASESSFVDASPDGRDVFILTGQSLVPQDPGLKDIYDAREGGGFPAPPAPPSECEGEACQGPPAPPSDSTPASASYMGPGNVPTPAKKKQQKKQKKASKHRGSHAKDTCKKKNASRSRCARRNDGRGGAGR